MSDGGGIGCWEGQVVNEPAPKREIITHAGSLLLISIIISESVPQGAQLYPTELHIITSCSRVGAPFDSPGSCCCINNCDSRDLSLFGC